MNTVNLKVDNPDEVIIIDSDEESEQSKHSKKKKCKHKMRSKLNHVTKCNFKISQTVKLDKFTYIINLDAEISDIKHCEEKIHERKHSKCSNKNKQIEIDNMDSNKTCTEVVKTCENKPVPDCLRPRCAELIRRKARHCEDQKAMKRLHSNKNYLRQKYIEKFEKPKHSYHKKSLLKNIPCNSDMLSSVSSTSFKDELTDSEDVTLKSVNSYDDDSLDSKPLTSDKLDMLIMRTKQRERKMQEDSRLVPEHRAQNLESEGEILTTSSSTSVHPVHSKQTFILEHKRNKMRSHRNTSLHSSYNLNNKTKYRPHNNRHTRKYHDRHNYTMLEHKNISKYSTKNRNKVETYIPKSIWDRNITIQNNNRLESQVINANNYPNYYTVPESRTYARPGFNNVISSYGHLNCYNKETHSHRMTHYNHIDYTYDNYQMAANKGYLLNSPNDNYNSYTGINNYPVELQRGPCYDDCTIPSQLSQIHSQIIKDNERNNYLHDPVKYKFWYTGNYSPN